MWWFLSTCCIQDCGVFQCSSRGDVNLRSKQNASTDKTTTIRTILYHFFFVIYFRTTISVISNDSETNNPSFTSQHFTSLFIAIYLRCYFSSSLNTRLNFRRHDIGFRATWLWISGNMILVSGNMTSGELTFGRLYRKPVYVFFQLEVQISSDNCFFFQRVR